MTETVKIWQSMITNYIDHNLSDGNFALFDEGSELVNSRKFKKILKKYKIDLSHLDGMTKEDLLFIAIPFDSIDRMFDFGNSFAPYRAVKYFGFGEYLGDNQDL